MKFQFINKPVGFALSLLASTVCLAADGGLKTWETALSIDARLTQQMERFSHDGSSLQPGFENDFAKAIKADIFARAEAQVSKFLAGQCQPFVSVDFLDGGSLKLPAGAQLNSVEGDFENGIVRVETVTCLKHAGAAKALSIFFTPDFRTHSVAQVSSSKWTDGLLCEKTDGVKFVVSSTNQCMALSKFEQPGISAAYGVIASNASGYQPVYFRENLVTFVDTPKGVAAHLVVYGRADRLSGIWHGLAARKLKSAQKDAFNELDGRLGR